jgi:hypothetical protein
MRRLVLAFGAKVSLLVMAVAVAVGCGSGVSGASGSAGHGGGDAGGGAGGASASNGGGGGNGAGRGGAGGGLVMDNQGIVVTVGTEVTEYHKNLLAYGGRPPSMEIFAVSDTAGTLRIVVGPDFGRTIVSGGTYPCHPGFTFLTLMSASSKQYDTYTKSGGSCTVTVTEAGPGVGDRFSGTFSGTLIGSEGDALELGEGSFLGVLAQ